MARLDSPGETPDAKTSEPNLKVGSDEWKAPTRAAAQLALPKELELPGQGARLDFGFEGARVHTFEAKGPLAFVLAVVVLLAVAAIFTMVFVFTVGVGVALAAGAAVAAALGMGAARIGRRLSGRRARELDETRREP